MGRDLQSDFNLNITLWSVTQKEVPCEHTVPLQIFFFVSRMSRLNFTEQFVRGSLSAQYSARFVLHVAVFILPCQHASRLASIAATCIRAQMRDSRPSANAHTQTCPPPIARTLNPFFNSHWAALPWFPVENKHIFWKDLENNGARRPGEGEADGKADVCRHAYMGSECQGLKGRKSVQCEQHCEQVTEQTLFAPPWALTGWESPGTFPLMHYCNGKTLHVRKLIWVWQTSIGQHFLRLTKTIHSWFTSQLLCNIRFPNFHATVSLSLSFALQFVMGYSSLKLDRCVIFHWAESMRFPRFPNLTHARSMSGNPY